MKKILLFLAIINFSSIISYAQVQNWLWAKSSDDSISNSSLASSVAVDASGNAFVAGYFVAPSITFGSTTLISAGSENIFLAKYDAVGNVLWAKSAGGIKNDCATSVAVDASGNIYVAGIFQSPTITFGSTILMNLGVFNIYLAKYDTIGNVLWAKSAGGTGLKEVSSIALDASGNIYVTGEFRNAPITFDSITLTNVGYNDMFLAKYDAVGNVLWAKSAGGTGSDGACSVSVDASGNAFVAGYFQDPSITFGSTTLTSAGSLDIFLAKYDAVGNVLWAKSAGDTSADMAYSVAIDVSGNIYVSGAFESPTITFGSTILKNAGFSNTFLAKYDATGNELWAKSADSSSIDGIIRSITIDAFGYIYAIGYFKSPTITLGPFTLTNAGSQNIFLAKYDALGNVLWAKCAGGTSSDDAGSVTADASGAIYISGYFGSHSINFGSTILTNKGAIDNDNMFLAKLSSTVGINKFNNTLISIYPNPAINNITIETPQQATIKVLNIQGQLMKTLSTSANKTNIDVSALPNGFYVVETKTEKGVVVRKFVKQ